MASSRGMAPDVVLPTVPTMGSSASVRPTKGTSTRASQRVVKVPRQSLRRTTPKVKAVKVRTVKPRTPKDAGMLHVPKAKRVRNFKEFSTKRKPVI